MTTTFQNRKLVRKEIAALFEVEGSYQEVFDHLPPLKEFAGKTPVFTIVSDGSNQDFEGLWNNPVTYRFLISSWVLATSEMDNYTSADAEDTLDDLDLVVRQVIRDNANLTNATNLRFAEGYSQVDKSIVSGQKYIGETRAVLVDLPSGAI